MPDDIDYFSAGGDPGADSSGFAQPADTGGVPPTTANDSSSSSGILDVFKQYAGTALNTAKTYYDFVAQRGAQDVQLQNARSAAAIAQSKAASDQQVAFLNGQAAVAAAQTKANAAAAAAARAAAPTFTDQLSEGKYNSLIIMLTLAGLGFAYLQSVHSSHE